MKWIDRNLGEYKPGETIGELAERIGIDPSSILKLNANENLFLSKRLQRKVVSDALNSLDPRLYPDEEEQLEKDLGAYLDVDPESIIVGNGSDQLIELIIYSILESGDEVVAINPTFSMYRRAVKIRGAFYKTVDLDDDFSLNSGRMLEAVTDRTKLMVICNPNNPTGNQFKEESIRDLITGFDGLVILDEAYIEFALSSMVRETEKYENLFVLRTFSKAFGLAGVRLGYAVTNPQLASVLKSRYQMPYNVSQISRMIGSQILKNKLEVMDSVDEAVKIREWLHTQLSRIPGVRVFDSDTNFILFNTQVDADKVYQKLLSKGIIIRKFGEILGYENCLRVTVAPMQQMEAFLTPLREVLK